MTDFRRKFTRYGEINNYELQIARKDGTIRDVSMSGYATRDAAGKIINYQGLIRDNTDAKRVRKQLMLSERLSAMGRMASQLAHELNNPLFGIMNCLECSTTLCLKPTRRENTLTQPTMNASEHRAFSSRC